MTILLKCVNKKYYVLFQWTAVITSRQWSSISQRWSQLYDRQIVIALVWNHRDYCAAPLSKTVYHSHLTDTIHRKYILLECGHWILNKTPVSRIVTGLNIHILFWKNIHQDTEWMIMLKTKKKKVTTLFYSDSAFKTIWPIALSTMLKV